MRIAAALATALFTAGVFSAPSLHASPVFVDWTSIDDATSTAAGTLNGIAVTLTTTNTPVCSFDSNGGTAGGVTTGISTAFSNGSYFSPSIASTDHVSLCSSSSFLFSFSQAVTNLTLHIAQLADTTVTFDSDFILVKSDGDFSTVTSMSIQGVSASDDANGSLLFGGPLTSLSWMASAPNGDDGVAIQFSIDVASVPEPSTLALLGLGLVGLEFGKRRRLSASRRG